MTRWRWITVLVSVVGIATVSVIWSRLDTTATGYLLLCSLPFLIGATAALLTTQPHNRIVLLWVAAALSGLVGVVTIMSGAGFVLLAGMAFYLLAAWGMNESTSRSAR